jgi:hypothetical protein
LPWIKWRILESDDVTDKTRYEEIRVTIAAWMMLAILVGMIGLLVWNKLPAWIVFVGTLVVTTTLGLSPEGDLLLGFATPGVAAGMDATGAISIIADKLISLPETLNMVYMKTLPPVANTQII